MNMWDRLTLFAFAILIVFIVCISLNEFLSMYGLVESFTGLNTKKESIPIRLILPQEYNHIADTLNMSTPILRAKTETVALEDVERRGNSCTLCSATSFSQYSKKNPDTRLSTIEHVDDCVVSIIVPKKSSIRTVKDLKQKVISCGVPGSAANHFMQSLANSQGWKQNRDFVVDEQVPNAIQLNHLFSGNSQIDAAIIVDTASSPVLRDIMDEHTYRSIDVKDSIPLLLVANSEYPANEILDFGKNIKKSTKHFYNIKQTVDMYKLPMHPTSKKVYDSLAFLG